MVRRSIPASVLLLFLGLTPVRAQVAGGQLPEDLFPQFREILENALLRSPNLLAQELEIAQAEARRYQDSAARWPSLTASTWYVNNRAEGENTTSSDGLVYSVNLSQPIYQWGALEAQSEIAALNQQITERRYADAFRNLAVTLRSQFLDLILLKGGVRQAEVALARQERALRELDARIQTGQAASGQRWTASHAVEQAQLTLDRQRAGYDSARRVFARAAGLADIGDEAIPMEIPQPSTSGSFTAVSGIAPSSNGFGSPQADILGLNIRQSELNYRIAEVRLRPKVFFRAGYGLDTSTSVDGAGRVNQANVASTNIRVGFDWTFFDGRATRGAKLSALASRRSYERQLESYLSANDAEIEGARGDLEFARRDLALIESELGVNQQGLVRADGLFADGRISQRELEDSQLANANLQRTVNSRRAAYLNAWSRYLSRLGIDPILNLLPERYLNDDR